MPPGTGTAAELCTHVASGATLAEVANLCSLRQLQLQLLPQHVARFLQWYGEFSACKVESCIQNFLYANKTAYYKDP
jgi:hypothetical protein